MSQRRIKKRGGGSVFKLGQAASGRTRFQAEAVDICREMNGLAEGERLAFALAALSDDFLLHENNASEPTLAMLLTIGVLGRGQSGATGILKEDQLFESVSQMSLLLRVEELRRAGLADIPSGYPRTLGSDPGARLRLESSVEELGLSSGARKVLNLARQMSSGQP